MDMSVYVGTDLKLDYPNGWLDRSMIAFAAPQPGKIAPNILILRDLATLGPLPENYAERQIEQAKKLMEGFVLIGRRQAPICGIAAVELDFTWISNRNHIRQKQNFLVVGETLYTITFTAHADEALEAEPIFTKMRGSIQFLLR
jgi:hypothetical protein